MILVIFIKAVAELGVIPYTHLFIVNFLLAIKPKIFKITIVKQKKIELYQWEEPYFDADHKR